MKIVLMRHGKPSMDLDLLKSKKLSLKEVGEIFEKYEAIELDKLDFPPPKALKIAESCKIIRSSNLPRAVQSVKKLGIENNCISDSCFKEAAFPYKNWDKPILSLIFWAVTIRVAWVLGFYSNGESFIKAKERAKIGARKLHDLALENGSVFLLGHGLINKLLASELKKIGWKQIKAADRSYWSYSIFELN